MLPLIPLAAAQQPDLSERLNKIFVDKLCKVNPLLRADQSCGNDSTEMLL